MGIQGLLPFLKKATAPSHLRELQDSTAAVDVYGWLHRGAFGCAEKLVQGQPTDGYVLYVMRYIDLLLHYNIKPVLVFDGRNLPSKEGTERKRRENRAKYRQMARDYLREGRNREARECFQRCVDVTPQMARDVIEACRSRNVDCIVAPYEADAQLAFLSVSGLADFVISEDSDLTPFGCHRILFKLDANGNGVLYEKKRLHFCLGTQADAFNFDKFRYMCIMAGCDYLTSLHGIGLGKSFKFWSRVHNPNVRQVLRKIPAYLKMPQLDVTDDYIEGFIRADKTFLYQLVFDPRSRKLRPLNEYPCDDRDLDMSFAGTPLDDRTALQLALGNVDLHSLEQVSYFRPKAQMPQHQSKFGSVAHHESIWINPTEVANLDNQVEKEQEPSTKLGATSHKRKLPEVSLDESTSIDANSEDISVEYKDSPAEQSITEMNIVYVSKYFSSSSNSATALEEANRDPPEETGSEFKRARLLDDSTPASKPAKNLDLRRDEKSVSGRSLLDDLDNETCHVRSTSASQAVNEPTKSQIGRKPALVSSTASNLPFKPVVAPSNEDLNTKLRRNPFMKQERSSQVPLSEVSLSSQNALSNRVSNTTLSLEGTPTRGDENATCPVPPVVVSDEKDGNRGISHMLEKGPQSGPMTITSSDRPSQLKKTMSTASKPKGASGLLKCRRTSSQRSLLDMWKPK